MTPVMFRKFNNTVIALFPAMPGTPDPWTCGSYLHVGQHGAASMALLQGHAAIPATADEYAPLLAELKRIGYDDLRVYKRCQPRFTAMRLNALRLQTKRTA